MSNLDIPWPNCTRCGGSGMVPRYRAQDYYVEDSSPREVPVSTCPECGGIGQVAPKNENGRRPR